MVWEVWNIITALQVCLAQQQNKISFTLLHILSLFSYKTQINSNVNLAWFTSTSSTANMLITIIPYSLRSNIMPFLSFLNVLASTIENKVRDLFWYFRQCWKFSKETIWLYHFRYKFMQLIMYKGKKKNSANTSV
jgi:hypothetical protein